MMPNSQHRLSIDTVPMNKHIAVGFLARAKAMITTRRYNSSQQTTTTTMKIDPVSNNGLLAKIMRLQQQRQLSHSLEAEGRDAPIGMGETAPSPTKGK
jgi:hypothetical protein